MACYWPLKAYIGPTKEKGKTNLVWRRDQSNKAEEIYLPCGTCNGCKLERSRQWAVRCIHESSLYEKNCFLTLTYNDENLPVDNNLDVRDFQLFMKRLRKKYGKGVRYYHCGEYGDVFYRPHYHAVLFNFDFDDKVFHSVRNGNKTYTSVELEKLWQKGFCMIGDVTFQSAGYVARYVMKKRLGKGAKDFYEKEGRVPEYTTMSRRPGIGRDWFDKYQTEVYPWDEVIVNGAKCKPPKYYDYLLDKSDKEMFKSVKEKRKEQAQKEYSLTVNGKEVRVSDNDSFRLPVKEKCREAKIKMLIRPLEEGI